MRRKITTILLLFIVGISYGVPTIHKKLPLKILYVGYSPEKERPIYNEREVGFYPKDFFYNEIEFRMNEFKGNRVVVRKNEARGTQRSYVDHLLNLLATKEEAVVEKFLSPELLTLYKKDAVTCRKQIHAERPYFYGFGTYEQFVIDNNAQQSNSTPQRDGVSGIIRIVRRCFSNENQLLLISIRK